jgi:hypothetical protein
MVAGMQRVVPLAMKWLARDEQFFHLGDGGPLLGYGPAASAIG